MNPKRKVILLSIIIGIIPLAFAIFYIGSSGVLTTTEQYTVRMKIHSVSTRWSSVREHGVMVVFLQHNNTVSEHWVGFAWKNVTLPKGAYTVRVHEGNSGVFIEEFEIYVAKDIEIKLSVG